MKEEVKEKANVRKESTHLVRQAAHKQLPLVLARRAGALVARHPGAGGAARGVTWTWKCHVSRDVT